MQSVMLPRDHMRKRGTNRRPVSVCPSVSPSVALVYCTAKDMKLFYRPGSPFIVVVLSPSVVTQSRRPLTGGEGGGL